MHYSLKSRDLHATRLPPKICVLIRLTGLITNNINLLEILLNVPNCCTLRSSKNIFQITKISCTLATKELHSERNWLLISNLEIFIVYSFHKISLCY
jgi:hypothetical protein